MPNLLRTIAAFGSHDTVLGIDAPEVDLFVEPTAGPLLAGVGNEVWGCHRYRPRSPCRRPAPRLGVHGRAEGASLHSAAGKARGHRRQRTTVRGELGSVALPKAVPRPRPGRQRGLSGRPTDGRGGTTTRARSGRRRVVRKTGAAPQTRPGPRDRARAPPGRLRSGRERGERINRKLIAVTKGWPVRRRVGRYCR